MDRIHPDSGSFDLIPILHKEKGTLGGYLRTMRKVHGKSLASAARKIGISQSHLSMIERDLSVPSLTTAARIAHYYDVPIEYMATIVLECQEMSGDIRRAMG